MNVHFRNATPKDVDAAVPLIFSSGPGAFNYIFSPKPGLAQEFLRYTFQDGAGELGYKNHIVGELDGKVVAVGAAFDGETTLKFFLAAGRQIVSFYGLSALTVILHGLQVEQIVQPPKGRLHYIAHLGVDPSLQSKGIGAKLVEYLMEQGRKAGKTQAALDVSVLNPRAQALYERLGFQLTGHRISTLEGVPSHNRLERAL
ncbi:MAG: GNAT family N-acetyltransferase [Anaerolineales bacterium]